MKSSTDIENHKRNCLARWLLNNKSRAQILIWIEKMPENLRGDMRNRLNLARREVIHKNRNIANETNRN